MPAILASDPAHQVEVGLREDRATTIKGAKRVTAILQVALDLLVEEGQAALTLEKVAKRVGIRKGNLQYYFRSRDDLVRAVLAQQIEDHRREWISAFEQRTGTPEDRLRQLIAFELDANRNQKFVAQVKERWALEARDAEARRLTAGWYDWITQNYATLIAEIRPDLDALTCKRLAMMMYAMLVGSAPFYGSAESISMDLDGLEESMTTTLVTMIHSAPAQEGYAP